MIVYVREQGAKISKESQRLVVTTDDNKRIIFTDNLEQLVIFGNVQLTTQSIYLLLRKNIDTVFLRYDGRYLGRLSNNESANVFLRKKQFDLLNDVKFCANFARSIVQAKLFNQATIMSRIKRAHKQPLAGDAASELRDIALKLDKTDDIDVMRGIEGSGAALYFKHFSLGLKDDWGFTKRVRRPPTDPVNAVLSLLYTLLINRTYAAVRLAGLDPYPAALHSLTYGRQSLPLDLVEEFRAMIADTLTLSLFNMHVLKKDDFEVVNNQNEFCTHQGDNIDIDAAVNDSFGAMSSEEVIQDVNDLSDEQVHDSFADRPSDRLPVLLKKDAFSRVIAAFSKKLDTEFLHPYAAKQMSYAEAIIYQARLYRKLVDGEINYYIPLTLR